MEGAMSQEKEIRAQIQSIENLIRNLKEQGEQAGLSQEQIQASIAPMESQRKSKTCWPNWKAPARWPKAQERQPRGSVV